MVNRECVIETLKFKQSERLPYAISLTWQMYEKMAADKKGFEYLENLNNYIATAPLNSPQKEIDGQPGFFVDEFGVVWNKTGADKDIGVIEGTLISDIETLDNYDFPEVDEKFIRNSCKKLEDYGNENFKVVDLGFSMFERAWTLCSMEDLLCYMITNPDSVHKLMQKITDYNLKKLDIALEYDFDCVLFGDDWGQQKGLIMGPAHWREFIKPYLKQMYDRVKAKNRYVAQHSCGDIHEIFDDVIEIGLNIYQTFQPEIYDINIYKPILDNRLTIWGGISTQVDLPEKTASEITEITKKTIDVMWQNGGYIAAPTHSVPFDVPVENMIAMIDVFENYNSWVT